MGSIYVIHNVEYHAHLLYLSIDVKKVTERVIELGDMKERVTMEDLPYIVADVLELEEIQENVKIDNYSLSHAKGLKPVAAVSINFEGKHYEANASGDGQYDAFMNALKHIYEKDLGLKLLPALYLG